MNNIQFEDPQDKPFKPVCFTIALTPLAVVAPIVVLFLWIYLGLPDSCQGLTTKSPDWSNSAYTCQLFNWHPFMMVLFLTFGAMAIFSFKMLPGGHLFRKIIHAILHTLAVTCSIIGFVFMLWYKKHTGGVNFWTMHSWIGVAILVCYWIQYLGGFFFFLAPGPQAISKRIRAEVVLGHRHAGLIIWAIVAATILSGISSKQWLLYLSGYEEYRGALYYGSDAVGVMVCVLAAFGLFVFRHIKPEEDEHHYSPIRDIEYR